MKRALLASLAASGLLAGCGSDDDAMTSTTPYQLTFQGDGSYGPHAGQQLRAAVVRVSDGSVLDRKAATVGTAGSDPSFSVTFTPMLDPAVAYRVHYWIDSNFGVGTIGTCDGTANDHQWSVDVPAGQATYKDSHRPGATASVCGSFPTYQVTFQGDGTFSGAHAGQAVGAALLRGVDGTVVERLSGVVAAGAPAFSFAFTTPLDPLSQYTVHYRIDSSFGGGALGACDPPANDHQWSVPLPAGQATVVDSHRPAATSSVCGSFPTYQLTFEGNGTFSGAHAGQAVNAALLRDLDGTVIERRSGTVAAATPSFSFSFAAPLDPIHRYTVHYWIDSNFGGGTVGVCDPPANDHQWSVSIPAGAAAYTDSHRPGATASVCGSFPP